MACVNCVYRVPVATAGAPPSLTPTAATCAASIVTPGSVDTHSSAACIMIDRIRNFSHQEVNHTVHARLQSRQVCGEQLSI